MRAASILFVAALLLSTSSQAGLLPDARALLFQGDIVAADAALEQVLAQPPTTDDAEAHALRSLTRVLRAIESGEAGPEPGAVDSIGELLDAFGFASAGRNILGWESSPPRDAAGRLDFPTNAPTGAVVASVADLALLSAISGALLDLAELEPGFR